GSASTVSVVLQRPGGGFADPRQVYSDPTGLLLRLDAGKYTDDRFADLVVVGASGVVLLPGGPDGTFGAPVESRPAGSGSVGSGVLGADFDGDGRLDLALVPGATSGSVAVALGAGDGTFLAPGAGTGGLRVSPVGADWDGDGVPDAFTLDPKGQIL